MLDPKQVTNEVERSFIRSAIYSMPRSWKLVALIVILVGTYFFGNR